MKKLSFILAAAMIMLAACNKQTDNTDKRLTFVISNEWEGSDTIPFRACTDDGLSANGSAMTDLWVFDYVDDDLQQQLHQTPTDSDWGTPSMTLTYGTHHLYFVASRGNSPSLDTDDHIISWTKASDTFFYHLSLTVNPSTPDSQPLTLLRVCGKLKMTLNDAIPSGVTSFVITPHTWYTSLDYLTGNPSAPVTDQNITVSCPSSMWGLSGQFLTIYSLSSTTEWTTDVTLTATDGSNTYGQATLSNVPMLRNRSSEYSGNLFTFGSEFTLSLNDSWDDPYNGGW